MRQCVLCSNSFPAQPGEALPISDAFRIEPTWTPPSCPDGCGVCSKPMKVHRSGKFKAFVQKDYSGASIGCVKCSVAANTGYLYLLDNCFVFLEKPPLVYM